MVSAWISKVIDFLGPKTFVFILWSLKLYNIGLKWILQTKNSCFARITHVVIECKILELIKKVYCRNQFEKPRINFFPSFWYDQYKSINSFGNDHCKIVKQLKNSDFHSDILNSSSLLTYLKCKFLL